MSVVDIAERLSLFSEHWSPKVVARLNDHEIEVVRAKGGFVWHRHPDIDELLPGERTAAYDDSLLGG